MVKPAKKVRNQRSSRSVSPRPTRRTTLTDDEALNRICDERRSEPRYPIEKLLKKMGHELVR